MKTVRIDRKSRRDLSFLHTALGGRDDTEANERRRYNKFVRLHNKCLTAGLFYSGGALWLKKHSPNKDMFFIQEKIAIATDKPANVERGYEQWWLDLMAKESAA